MHTFCGSSYVLVTWCYWWNNRSWEGGYWGRHRHWHNWGNHKARGADRYHVCIHTAVLSPL